MTQRTVSAPRSILDNKLLVPILVAGHWRGSLTPSVLATRNSDLSGEQGRTGALILHRGEGGACDAGSGNSQVWNEKKEREGAGSGGEER